MPSQNAIDERQQDEAMVLNLRERYASSFLDLYQLKMDGFLAIVSKDEKKFVKQIEKNKEHWKNELKRLRPYLKEAWPDVSLTPISLCSYLLLETYYTDTVGLALAYQREFSPQINGALFSAIYDYAAGFREIILNLLRAEIMTKNPDEQKHAKDVQGAIEMQKQLWGTTPNVDDSVAVYKKLQVEEAQFKDHIEKDPTGKQLLRYLVSLLKERTQGQTVTFSPTSALFSYQTSAFVHAGAKFAEQAYTTIYPLALL